VRLLWIATKSPWPPRDGGRLLLLETLRALAGSGVSLTLVAPSPGSGDAGAARAALAGICAVRWVDAAPRPRALAWLRSAVLGEAYSLARHSLAAVGAAVADELARGAFDGVVAEQLQAFAQSAPAVARGVPRFLRAQNVEWDLWRQLGDRSSGLTGLALRREARRLAAAERAAVGAASATFAVAPLDAARLAELSPGARVDYLPPPFPARLPAASRPLPGEPAVVLFGSPGWEPNRRATERFLAEAWPRLRDRRPGARLHLFGGRSHAAGVIPHPAPPDSAEAFAAGAVLALPLDVASGVRMRILEAWARGVPVVASVAAASGLAASDGVELLIADRGEAVAAAIDRLAGDPALTTRLVDGGRARLASDHASERFAERFRALVERA